MVFCRRELYLQQESASPWFPRKLVLSAGGHSESSSGLFSIVNQVLHLLPICLSRILSMALHVEKLLAHFTYDCRYIHTTSTTPMRIYLTCRPAVDA